MKPNHPITWQPIRPRAGADPLVGIRAPVGTVGASRILMGIRAAGFGRGEGVPNGIVLKEGET